MPKKQPDGILPVKKSLKEMRKAKKQFIQETFSKEDLVKTGGLTKEEIAKIATTIKYGVERYERFYVSQYLKYDRK